MCLIAVDGTWSVNFNSAKFGKDHAGRPIGNKKGDVRSNAYRFYEESKYLPNQKFYFAGPDDGPGGSDSPKIYANVLKCIDAQLEAGNCKELALVGWSRGAAIVTEIAEGLAARDKPVPVKFVGLFDSVAMINVDSPVDKTWAEDITSNVQSFAHVIAGDRSGETKVFGRTFTFTFVPANPSSKAATTPNILNLAQAKHGDVGGDASTELAKKSYDYIRNHATLAGVR